MEDQILVLRCKEKIVERKESKSRARMGRSKGVEIQFHCQVRVFCIKKAVRAMRVTMWMMVMAQPWTEARKRGVKMSRA